MTTHTTTELYTIKEVASRLKVSKSTLGRYIKDGKLEVMRFEGKTVRISEDAIAAFLARHKEEAKMEMN